MLLQMTLRAASFVQVAVIDEVQMVGDPNRGASFTRAVLGLPAKFVHVCGDPAALPLLRLMALEAGSTPPPPPLPICTTCTPVLS